jgi:Transposase C of IS166 homeodomain
VEKGTPTDPGTLLLRFAEMEKEIAFLKAELARKDRIIAGLQQRLFGSSSEKIDPAQLQLLFDEILLGKPGPLPETSGETSAPEEAKPSAPKNRRTKAERFPSHSGQVLHRNMLLT